MPTFAIPKKLIPVNDDLIMLPRKEYEALLHSKNGKGQDIVVKRSKSFKVAKKHEKFYDELDKELTETLRDYHKGNYYGPFHTAEEGIAFLHSRESERRKNGT